jgi:microcystin-dependent protein
MPTTPILQLPYPTSADSADVPRDIKALADKLDPLGTVPVGSMMMWPAVSAPAGVNGEGNPLWLVMLGQVIPATTYPGLVPVLGSAGGNITIPNMSNLFPVGAGAVGLGALAGQDTVGLTAAQMPAHNHNGATGGTGSSLDHSHPFTTDVHPGHSHPPYGVGDGGNFVNPKHGPIWIGVQNYVGAGNVWLYIVQQTDPAGAHSHNGATYGVNFAAGDSLQHTHPVATEGGGQAHENRPRCRGINFIIRASG